MSSEADVSSRAAVFEQHRRLLFSIAYRMLGSVADAEDALQDAFIRWQRAPEVEIRSPKAFLVTIVSRISVSHLQSARAQRETYVGEWLPEPIVTGPGSDVARLAQIDESVSMAVLLLLERLTPIERAVFLLAEIFDYTHAEIGAMLDLTEPNCRQILRRARQHVRMERPRFGASTRQHTDLLQRFHQAAGSGDMDGLLALLSSDVVMHTDGGGKASALPLPIFGADKVARASVFGQTRLMSLRVLQRIVELNGEPGIVSYLNGRPQSVFTIHVKGGRITAIFIVTNPEKLSHLPPPPS
jgi:RNA polymerase sigma-70 factor (ECF subfamily)